MRFGDETEAILALTARMKSLRGGRSYAEARAAGSAGLTLVQTKRDAELLDVAIALATYKDPEYPVRKGLNEASALLARHVHDSSDPETLGVAGAVEKRRYELDLQISHLESAYDLYQRGHVLDREHGWPRRGYAGINAAYLLEVLEKLQPRDAASLKLLRERLWAELASVPPPPATDSKDEHYFHRVTVADALLGLGRYDEALAKYGEARALQERGWELETSARQLAAALRLRSPDGRIDARGRLAIQALVGDDADAVASAIRGKLGVGLSGGGFRASLFHIGVLSWLAELDLLRHVEVLSCVSGGSLLGAAYHLELQALYADKRDADIQRQDFVDLVARLAERFPAAIRHNLRVRVLFDPEANAAMLRRATSRTERIAELYEQYLYSRIGDAGVRDTPRFVDELLVKPRDAPDFHPAHDNWRRRARVPTIIFNAASLNTGHAFCFSPTGMGEPPARGDEDVDVNDRFERAAYDAFPDAFQRIRLGHAVGASACVPVLFEPLELRGAYGNNVVRLVDGGLFDNQGAGALLEQDCTSLIVSDASGQLSLETAPSGSEIGVGGRSNSVLQARLREAQYQDLRSRERGNLLRGLSFLHLKQGLTPRRIPPHAASRSASEENEGDLGYGVSRAVQERLAALRTDLDAFSELEAEMLMASGYKMAKRYIDPERYAVAVQPTAVRPTFLRVESLLLSTPSGTDTERTVLRLLEVGESLVGKAFRVNEELECRVTAFKLVAGTSALALLLYFGSSVVFSVTAGTLAAAVVTKVLVSRLPQAAPWVDAMHAKRTIVRELLGYAFGLAAALISRLSVKYADPIFLQAGEVEPLLDAHSRERAELHSSRVEPATPRSASHAQRA